LAGPLADLNLWSGGLNSFQKRATGIKDWRVAAMRQTPRLLKTRN